jgi:hypothetical protein
MQVGSAIEPDKGIADDVLPDGKPPVRSRGTGIEHDSQDWPPALKSNLIFSRRSDGRLNLRQVATPAIATEDHAIHPGNQSNL